MGEKSISFAVTGWGHIGKRHADVISAHAGARLAAVIDINEGLEQHVKKKYNVPFFTSLEAFLLSGIKTDVLNIATPNSLHAVQAVQAIEHGLHVVVEKPLALTARDGNRILSAAKKYGKHVFCVMQNRYSAPARWLKKLVGNRSLGDIYMVHINCFWNRDRRYYNGDTWHGTKEIDGGTIFTQFSHYVDLLYWLFGTVTDIHARFGNYNHKDSIEFEDSGIISFRLVNGGSGTLNYTTAVWDRNMESTMIVIGEKGTVKIGGQYMDKLEYCHVKDVPAPEFDSGQELTIAGYTGARANHYYVIQNVTDVLNGKAGIDTCAEEGIEVIKIIEEIYALK